MKNDWELALDSLSKITVYSNPNNAHVTISGGSDDLKCIGVGTDAAVFRSLKASKYAFKKYATDKTAKVDIEASVYERLGNSSLFPTYFASGDDYLVLSYEEGKTLFDCVLQGVHIPEQVVDGVEEGRDYIRTCGLNPRDIHLKNILLQDGKAKILDVSEYIVPGNDFRWEDLKEGYKYYYHLIDGKPVPFWLVEMIRKWYHQQEKVSSSFEAFERYILHFVYKKDVK